MINSVTLKCACGKSCSFLESSFPIWTQKRYSCGCKESELESYPVQKLIWLSDHINTQFILADMDDLFEPLLLTTDYNPTHPHWLCINSFIFKPTNMDEMIYVALNQYVLPEPSPHTIILGDVSEPFEELSLSSMYVDQRTPELDQGIWDLVKALKYWNWESLQIQQLSKFEVSSCVFENYMKPHFERLLKEKASQTESTPQP